MKKWMYLIFPGIMLAGFLVIYTGHRKEAEAKEIRMKAEAETARLEAEKKKKEAETKAREDARKRQEEREAEERKKEEEKAAKQAKDDKMVRDQIAEYTAKADSAQKQVNALEIELDKLRKEKDRVSRETFDLAKQLELARVERRNAELEIQRMHEMIVRKASESSLVRPPAIAPAPARPS
jgi:hypothetical protein